MKKILLITIGLSALLFADFTKSGDIVTDTSTGLQWQDDVDAKNNTRTWSGAIDYCENLTLGGYSDWRLPNINELKSIVDRSKYSPAIADGFSNVRSGYYWSSTTRANDSDVAWVVSFYYGSVSNYGVKNRSHYVRCVRAGQ